MVFPLVMYGSETWTLNAKELRPSKCGAGEDSCKSLGPQGDQTSQGKSTLNTCWKDWFWSWSSSILVIWCEQSTPWKSPWCWERLRAEGEESIRGWGGWLASPMQWTWTWANFRRWWGTERPGVLQSMRSQRVGHDWVTELNWSSYIYWGWKPHDLLSVSWTLQREPVVRVSQSRDTRVWMSEGRRRWMSQLKQGQQIHPSSVLLIHSGSQGIGWCLPHIEDHLF